MNDFGRLQRVELRQGWLSEAQHFTPWLALDDNLALLSETLGIDLELEAQERADILCKDTADADPTNEVDWPRQQRWLAENLQRLQQVFGKRTHGLSDARQSV